jgi:hypothetical protein
MIKLLLGAAAVALLVSGCYVEETPQYAPRCQTMACSSGSPVVVKVTTPPPPPVPAVRARCPAGHYWHPGRARWIGRRWVVLPGHCRRLPGPHLRRGGCFFARGRWVRVWQGWRRVPGRWICRR